MTPPSLVVFDLGKVLLDFDYAIAARKLGQHCPRTSPEAIVELLLQTPLLLHYENGSKTREQFYCAICEVTGYSGSPETFAALFGDIFHPIREMVDLHSELRAAGHPTCILSNTNDLAVEFIRRRFPFFANFDAYVFSYEHGCMKPEEKLYRVVERLMGKSGSQIVYIDDRPENIETGVRLGWNGIVHTDTQSTKRALVQLGLLKG